MPNDTRLQQEPNPTIVRRLLDFGVLREGGRASLSLAAVLAQIAEDHEGNYPVDAVADRMRRDLRFTARVDDTDDLVIVAGEIVDIVRAHGSAGSGEGPSA